MDNDGKLVCQICGFISHNLGLHIRKHNMSVNEYKDRFSIKYVQSEKMIKAHKDNAKGSNNPTTGRKRSDEEKALISKNRTGKGIGVSGKYERTNAIKEKISNSVSKLHLAGVYDNVLEGISGYIYSTKMETSMHYKSTWERRLIECMDIFPRITAFYYEPCRIKYYYDGSIHHYIPDFLVVYDYEITGMWEVKRQDMLDHDFKTQAKMDALHQYCFEKNFNLNIITLKYLEKLEKHLKQCSPEELEDYDVYIRKYSKKRY